MLEYLGKAASVWFMGFFPLAEIYVAVPAAFALGLDAISSVIWSVAGNYAPVLMIHFLYDAMAEGSRLKSWLRRIASPKVKGRMERYGFWFVFVVTPWTGVWIMAATVRLFGMGPRLFLISSFLSILVYAVVLAVLIQTGVNLWS